MDHNASFHAALNRMSVVAHLFERGLDEDQMLAEAKNQGLTERDANLAIQLLPEACGCVFANELGIHTPSEYQLKESSKTTSVSMQSDADFQAAFFLAHHFRRGGRNDLFQMIVKHSSIITTVNKALNSGMQLKDLEGGSISSIVIWF